MFAVDVITLTKALGDETLVLLKSFKQIHSLERTKTKQKPHPLYR